MKYFPGNDYRIFAITYQGKTSWYITPDEWWILSSKKSLMIRAKKNVEMGRFETIEKYLDYWSGIKFRAGERDDYPELDSENILGFLNKISDYQVSTQDLRELMEIYCMFEDPNTSDLSEMVPRIYMDFDKKIMSIVEYNLDGFRDYIPDGWQEQDIKRDEIIPTEMRYWIINSENMFEKRN